MSDIQLQNRTPQLKNVQTILVTKNGNIVSSDASNDKGTLNTIYSKALSFGQLSAGETSETKIIYLNVPSALAIRDIKIGLSDTGTIPFSTGKFCIEVRQDIDYNLTPLIAFTGLNTDNTASNINNVSIANAGENFSQYVYINVTVPKNQFVGDGVIKLIWFFNYA